MLPGVYLATSKNGSTYYRSNITFRNKHISLGSFDNITIANEAYNEACKILDGKISINDIHKIKNLSLDKAKKIYAEISGYGTTSDAYHITCPDPDGEGAAKAMALALKEGKVEADEVSYINAHGTSTEFNDKFETIAIKKVFGENAYNIPVSSTKAMTGHLLGAAGAIEAVISAKAISDSYIPATINYKVKDEDCDLDYVPNEGRNKELKYVLSNSFGFGGHNAVLLFKKWEE